MWQQSCQSVNVKLSLYDTYGLSVDEACLSMLEANWLSVTTLQSFTLNLQCQAGARPHLVHPGANACEHIFATLAPQTRREERSLGGDHPAGRHPLGLRFDCFHGRQQLVEGAGEVLVHYGQVKHVAVQKVHLVAQIHYIVELVIREPS